LVISLLSCGGRGLNPSGPLDQPAGDSLDSDTKVARSDSGGGGLGTGGGAPLDGNPAEIRPGPPEGGYVILDSVDPFTREYLWEDGTLLVGNVSDEELQGFIEQGVEYFDNQVIPTEMWIDPETGEPWEIVLNEIRVYFDETVDEQDLRGMFDANDFTVVFSWFEPGQVAGTNLHASFQLEYDRQTFPTVDDALGYLRSLPYTLEAVPNYYSDTLIPMAPPVDYYSYPWRWYGAST